MSVPNEDPSDAVAHGAGVSAGAPAKAAPKQSLSALGTLLGGGSDPRFLLLCGFLPILVGGLIYILFRDESLCMFTWARALGLGGLVQAARVHSMPYVGYLPEWLLFSLPDGAWVFACTAVFARLWPDGPWPLRLAWIGMGSILAIGGEIGQWFGFVPGTFDPTDLVAYALAGVMAFWLANAAFLGVERA